MLQENNVLVSSFPPKVFTLLSSKDLFFETESHYTALTDLRLKAFRLSQPFNY